MNFINNCKKVVNLSKVLPGVILNKTIFVNYFNSVSNVGDQINIDIMQHYSCKNISNTPGNSLFKHYLVVGSVLHNMNKNSVVMGSGLIHPSYSNQIRGLGNIKILRGLNSLKIINDKFSLDLKIPLGDPAILFPKIHNPVFSKKYKFGLVLHYVDINHPIKSIAKEMGANIISVSLSPKDFVNEMLKCENIISSSMHGLILADAYNIPNKRLILSSDITGGDYKYSDYYSVTKKPNEMGVHVNRDLDSSTVEKIIRLCTIKDYKFDLSNLENEFLNLRG